MEEYVGGLWDRLITHTARRDHPKAAVHLADIEKTLGVFFRALGGDAGLGVAAAADERHGARRRWLERLAGTGEKAASACRDQETLRLPPRIAVFATPELNRDLYLWLAALAAHDAMGEEDSDTSWLAANQQATRAALARYPGLASRYRRLVTALLAERIAPAAMPADEAAQEAALRQALEQPGSVSSLPPLTRRNAKPLQPVPLWLAPAPVSSQVPRQRPAGDPAEGGGEQQLEAERKRHKAQQVDAPDSQHGILMFFRAESLLSWAEFIKVDRSVDDDPDQAAGRAAEDMDTLAVMQNNERVAGKVRFDLDLPSAACDDIHLGDGIPLPEWDWKKHQLKPTWCRLQRLVAREATPQPLPSHLRRAARKLKSQFAALQPTRRWQKAQPDGTELDIDACVRVHADRMAGQSVGGAGLYLANKPTERDLACLVLADLSLSTDAWVSDTHRVIDVIRDSLMLFGEALGATGDRFGLYGFSSLKRSHVRCHELKDFAAPFDAQARGRIAALKPGYYTRIGAAIRHATSLLEKQPNSQRLLLILSDGKPHDIDVYEGRYGIEDTRMAVMEARQAGIKPFCVTIDKEGAAYLPHLFGPAGFTVVRKPEELPARLPLLYAQITGR
jgi:nitric oxide reductase NorD protein